MIEEYKKYYNNGQLEIHYFYKDDDLHGEYKVYYSNGQTFRHCFFKDGKLHGEFKSYYKNGELLDHAIYVDNYQLDINPATLSNEGKLVLKLKHNIEFIDD